MDATEQGVIAVIRASRPNFRGAHDKIAFTVHSSFLAAGYVLTAAGPAAFSDDVLTSSSTDEVGIDGWDQVDDNYGFVYLSPEKGSKKILVKCLGMNETLLVDVVKNGDEEPLHLEINVNDYTVENGGSNYSAQFKALGKLVTSINKEILGKLTAPSASSSEAAKSSSVTRGSTADSYTEPEPQPYNPSGVVFPPVYPGIGGNDLFPGTGAGMYPSRGDFGIGGGNLVGPDNPLFNMRFDGQRPVFPGAMPPGVPPGARYDPYGPPGVPGFEPNRFARNPPRPGGGVHPDLEQFRRDDFI
ncbi:putative proteasome inhibitor [Heracleum sosnowskyi]|uniref:Proteasome inhibitor n=1 Tax=Heracleum sosnowskyi TaxID=360622 RepID=A0AAD8I417_9APIA|nr:putative proteasome inhibitor [Heracleum sosnowskyi]